MSAIGGLLYLAKLQQPEIVLATNLLARYIFSPNRRQQNDIKHIFCFLSEVQLIQIDLDGFIQETPSLEELVLQMHDTYQILIKSDCKPAMVVLFVDPRSLGVPRNKLWLRLLQIMHNLLRFPKHVKNVYGLGQKVITYRKQMEWLLRKRQQKYLKTTRFLLLNSKKAILRAIE